MMKRVAAFVLLAGFITGLAAGQAERETRNFKGFEKVSFGIAGNLNINIGPDFRIVLEGSKKDLDMVVTEISGNKLIIKQESWRYRFDEKVNINVTMPVLEGLSVSGSGHAEILDDVKNADDLYLTVSGSGKLLTAGLEVDNLSCSISGSGDIVIGSKGSADDGQISISGSGGYSGEDLEIDHLKVNVSGSGSCLCRAGDSLEARISGSGNVTYRGNPRIDTRVSGSGKVRSAQ